MLTSLALALLFVLAGEDWPDPAKNLMANSAKQAVCEAKTPRHIKAVAFTSIEKDWLLRIFSKDGEELEIWINYDMSRLLALYFPDEIYYKTKDDWVARSTLDFYEADVLDRRLKFTRKELEFFKSCFEKQL